MKKAREFEISVAPGCHYLARIVIYKDTKALNVAFAGFESDVRNAEAFCITEGGENDRIATLYFSLDYATPEIVAHEVFHAVMELIKVLRLNMNDSYAQEVAAHATTHLVRESLKAVRLAKRP